MQGDHVISVLTEGVADSYLAHLKDIGVSYIFAGKTKVDLQITVRKLRSLFGIEKLMLEGGGHINGSFLDEGLVDQVEQLLLPLADGTAGAATFFDMDKNEKKSGVTLLKLQEVKQIDDDVLWITYKVRR
jgi:riboflavin biosynthesis pyrimidine reductase